MYTYILMYSSYHEKIYILLVWNITTLEFFNGQPPSPPLPPIRAYDYDTKSPPAHICTIPVRYMYPQPHCLAMKQVWAVHPLDYLKQEKVGEDEKYVTSNYSNTIMELELALCVTVDLIN